MKPKQKICDGCMRLRPIWKSRGGRKLCKVCAGVDIIPKPTAKRKPISPRSSKQVKLEKQYSEKRKKFLSEHPLCEANLGCCSGLASDVHHKKGRGVYLLDESTYLALCRACHIFIETNPDIAKSMGWSESRLKTTLKPINSMEEETEVKTLERIMAAGGILSEVEEESKVTSPVEFKIKKFVNLFYKEGGSDKVYNIQMLEGPSLGEYMVNFAYGRRGSSLVTGTKTVKPLSLAKADIIYNRLLREKVGKGYKEELNSDKINPGLFRTLDKKEETGYRPQLLNDIPESEVEKYINNPLFCMQEKYDGRNRLLIQNKSEDAIGGNKKGQKTSITQEVIDALRYAALGWSYVLNGEDMGSHVMIFDYIPSGDNMVNIGYKERYKFLQDNFNFDDKVLRLAPTAWTTEEKQKMFDDIKSRNGEGVVFKSMGALHSVGKPASGGTQVKFKFYATASCIVTSVNNTKRSVSLSVYDMDGSLLPIGNATVYPNQEVPTKYSVVEIKYLYWYKGGSLVQPILLGTSNCERDDITPEECFVTQLKAKAEPDEE